MLFLMFNSKFLKKLKFLNFMTKYKNVKNFPMIIVENFLEKIKDHL